MTTDSSYGQIIRLPKRPRLPAQEDISASTHHPAPALTDMLGSRPADPSATGFVLSLLRDASGPILWIQDHPSRRENGSIYAPGLVGFGMVRPVLQVNVSRPRDVLWAMEEGANCAGLSAVVGEIHGAPAVLDFTATKRLAMRADASGVPIYLIRSGDPGVLSSARERWRVASLPSQSHPHDVQSPGLPQWDVDLFRARARTPGRWVAQYDPHATRSANRLNLVSQSHTGTMDAHDQTIPHSPRR